MPKIINIAAYKFTPLADLRTLRDRLLAFCKGAELRGTILLSHEGINLFVAGLPEKIDSLLAELQSVSGLENLQPKLSETDHQPFRRMLVRIKKEIIAFGVDGINPALRSSPKLPAKQLKQWLDEGKPFTLLDTRNDYEVKLGTFKNALPLGIDTFRQFPDAIAKLPETMKDAPIVMFCTGGIRCEKAGPFMEREGFQQIFQLDGGILKYFEECGGAHYDGECFVFDQRVGVDPALHETESAQCFQCLSPLTAEDRRDPRYALNESCPYCFKTSDEKMREEIANRQLAITRATNPLPGSVPHDNFRPTRIPAQLDGSLLANALAQIAKSISADEWRKIAADGFLLNEKREPVSAEKVVHAGEIYLHKLEDQIEPDVNAAIEILHEDEALIVLNKPAPLPMHAAGRFHRNSLQSILAQVYAPQKPRHAHRLDANTTGVLLATRTRHFAGKLQPQFANGEVQKTYLVRVHGAPTEDEFACGAAISDLPQALGSRAIDEKNGQSARTEFRVLSGDADGTSLLEARPITGRTHQIRIHLWHLGFAVCGDPLYLANGEVGKKQTLDVSDPPLCLHAWKIEFAHPLTRKRMEFSAPPPAWAMAEEIKSALICK